MIKAARTAFAMSLVGLGVLYLVALIVVLIGAAGWFLVHNVNLDMP